MKSKPIVCALALSSLFIAILRPPEAYTDSKVIVLLCATFPFLISMVERRISSKYLWSGLVLFVGLLAHSLWLSVDLYRSLDFISMIWAYYCLTGFFLYAGFEPMKPLAICMVVLSVIVSGYGLIQYFWGLDELYNYVFYSASSVVLKESALGRIASRRIFSTLALPGTLWGFLLIALPFHAAVWRRG